jgi:hypothetical protein
MRNRERGRGSDRGQTLQDYVLGVSVFLLVVIGLLTAILPTVLAPFEDTVGGDKTAQADRIAGQLVGNTTVSDNHLNASALEQVVSADQATLRDRFSLPRGSTVNITVSTMDGSSRIVGPSGGPLSSPRSPGERPAASSVRIVTLNDDSSGCQPACRLVVRVW